MSSHPLSHYLHYFHFTYVARSISSYSSEKRWVNIFVIFLQRVLVGFRGLLKRSNLTQESRCRRRCSRTIIILVSCMCFFIIIILWQTFVALLLLHLSSLFRQRLISV